MPKEFNILAEYRLEATLSKAITPLFSYSLTAF